MTTPNFDQMAKNIRIDILSRMETEILDYEIDLIENIIGKALGSLYEEREKVDGRGNEEIARDIASHYLWLKKFQKPSNPKTLRRRGNEC